MTQIAYLHKREGIEVLFGQKKMEHSFFFKYIFQRFSKANFSNGVIGNVFLLLKSCLFCKKNRTHLRVSI